MTGFNRESSMGYDQTQKIKLSLNRPITFMVSFNDWSVNNQVRYNDNTEDIQVPLTHMNNFYKFPL